METFDMFIGESYMFSGRNPSGKAENEISVTCETP
jgi:hypothetical protein